MATEQQQQVFGPGHSLMGSLPPSGLPDGADSCTPLGDIVLGEQDQSVPSTAFSVTYV